MRAFILIFIHSFLFLLFVYLQVDLVKAYMLPFMKSRRINGSEAYKEEYKQRCRSISEGLTLSEESLLRLLTKEEIANYWRINFVKIQNAVQQHFEDTLQ